MEIRELCQKLKPVIGDRADALYVAYLAEDSDGRRELETALGLLAAQTLGVRLEQSDVHLSAPSAAIASGQYPVGKVVYADKVLHAFALRDDELIQHVAIFGRSGAGKTNTLLQIIRQFLEHDKPFLIFDWKRNYRDLLAVTTRPVRVYTVGRATIPLAFNPLIPPDGTEPAVWLKKLIEIIAHAYYLGEGVMYLLQEAIHHSYERFGVYRGVPPRYPTFEDVYAWLREQPVKGRQALWMDSAVRGIKSICFGHMGSVVNTPTPSRLVELLNERVILELDGLTNADKTLITESMLLWIHHYRMRQPERERFHHAIIIEEAHHILRRQSGGGAEPITETVLREIRELGEAIVLVDQHPSMISIPALGNTYTTICMNLKHQSDVSAMASAMLLNDHERDILGELAIGMAVVKLQGRWTRPFLITIPHHDIPKGAVDDTTLIQLMEQRCGIVPNSVLHSTTATPGEEISSEPTELERALIQDIARHPWSGVVERYRRLGVSRRKGNAAKLAGATHGLVRQVDIPTRSGRIVLLELTDNGARIAEECGVKAPDTSRWGSLEHEYWKQRIADHLEKLGFSVRLEEPVNGFTDIVAAKGERTVAIEVETGKSDWQANIQKNQRKGFDTIIVAATNEDARNRIAAAAQDNGKNVLVMLTWEIVETDSPDRIVGQ